MSERHRIELNGCTPEPLMSYLKALGILRLVSEQADREALGCWDRDVFVLETALDHAELEAFFLERYAPTPILGPWNAGCGLYKKWDAKGARFKSRVAAEAMERVEQSGSERLRPYRDALARLKKALAEVATPVFVGAEVEKIRHLAVEEGWSSKRLKKEIENYLNSFLFFELNGRQMAIQSGGKEKFLQSLRSRVLSDSALLWLDASMVLTTGLSKNRLEAPLLGTGGNIGNSEFSARFAQVLLEVVPFHTGASVPEDSARMLTDALWGGATKGLLGLTVDQFAPGWAGGFNMGQGIEASPTLNPWEYILMIEGSLLMGGSGARRSQTDPMTSAFPFVVDSSPVGFASAGKEETRREIWLPLWNNWTSFMEVRLLLSEGRSTIGRHGTRNGVEQAIAAATLSVDRGIHGFSRVQFQKRFGDNYLANNVGRFAVSSREFGPVLEEIESWVEPFRRGASRKGTPPRLLSAVRAIENEIFRYCGTGLTSDLLAALVAAGAAERELSITGGVDSKGNVICRPARELRGHWVPKTDDQSAEFEIALALASIHSRSHTDSDKIPPPIRTNLEPVKPLGRHRWSWDESAPSVVWTAGGLSVNLDRVLSRRLLLEGGQCNLAFHHGVRLSTIAKFLNGEVDEARIAELVWALVLVDTQKAPRLYRDAEDDDGPLLPRSYAVLKPLFLPWALDFSRERQKWRYDWSPDKDPIKLEPRILPILRANRTQEACAIAERRLLVSGVPPLRGAAFLGEAVDPVRLAAALLLPVRDEDLNRLLSLVAHPPAMELQGA